MNPSRRSALMLSIVAHLLVLYALVHWAAMARLPKMSSVPMLTIHLIPALLPKPITLPTPAKLVKNAVRAIVAPIVSPDTTRIASQQQKTHRADQISKSTPVADAPTTESAPTPTPAPQNNAKPQFADPAALVKAYGYEASKSDLQRAIESHGGTVKVIPRSKYEEFHDAAEYASIPDCLGPDALRHDPPKIGPVGLSGLLALPFLAHAAVTGKCK